MKLFVYDQKHERVNHELDLGPLRYEEEEMLWKVIFFLESVNITNRYNKLAIADTYQMVKEDPDDDFPFVEFD